MSIATAPGRMTSRIPPLLRGTAFRRYWGAQSISLFGDQISAIALPLAAVLALHASPAEMGYLSALIWLPSLLFALHAGAWVDRRGHRRATMIAADLGRAALLTSIPVCSALGVLSLAQVFAVAFAAGTLSIFFTVSDSGLFVSLVPSDQYVAGNSLIYQSRALAAVGGPSAGGLAGAGAVRAVRAGGRCAVLPRLGVFPEPDPPGRASPGPPRPPGGAERRCPLHLDVAHPAALAGLRIRDQLLQLHVHGPVPPLRDPVAARPARAARRGAGRGRGRRRTRVAAHPADREPGRGRPGLPHRLHRVPRPGSARPAGGRSPAADPGDAVHGRVRLGVRGDDPGHQHRHDLRGCCARSAPGPGLRCLPGRQLRHPPGGGAGRRGRGHADRGAPGALDRGRRRDAGLPVPASLAAAPLPP